MKPEANSAKDLAYQQMIFNKLHELDTRIANLFPYTNTTPELKGGTRQRSHPLPGVTMQTYEPSTLSVGGNQDDFLSNLSKNIEKSKPQIQRPLRKNATITNLNGGNKRIDIVKK